MYTEIEHNETHNSQVHPILKCIYCDKEINRPIKRCFGLGSSETVLPNKNEKQ